MFRPLVVTLALGAAACGPAPAPRCLVPPAEEAPTPHLAAQAWLDRLDEGQRARAVYDFDDPARTSWSNLPARLVPRRAGVAVGELDEAACAAASGLWAALASADGRQTADDIMHADDVLAAGAAPNVFGFSSGAYHLAVFGTPSRDGIWAVQLSGHHLALNATFRGDEAAHTPSFWGVEPTTFAVDGEPRAPLERHRAAGLDLANHLAAGDVAEARVDRPADGILRGAGQDATPYPSPPDGLAASQLDDDGRTLLRRVLDVFLDRLPDEARAARAAALSEGFEDTYFAWSGDLADDSADAYYRVHGPAVWIEFSFEPAVAGGDGLPHFHSVVRNPLD